jgi:hypothetical protein
LQRRLRLTIMGLLASGPRLAHRCIPLLVHRIQRRYDATYHHNGTQRCQGRNKSRERAQCGIRSHACPVPCAAGALRRAAWAGKEDVCECGMQPVRERSTTGTCSTLVNAAMVVLVRRKRDKSETGRAASLVAGKGYLPCTTMHPAGGRDIHLPAEHLELNGLVLSRGVGHSGSANGSRYTWTPTTEPHSWPVKARCTGSKFRKKGLGSASHFQRTTKA